MVFQSLSGLSLGLNRYILQAIPIRLAFQSLSGLSLGLNVISFVLGIEVGAYVSIPFRAVTGFERRIPTNHI